ncbi:hypothetical protein P3S67_019473 [Capsicum chacoense]|uniref:DUF7722 domain-containing protein n=1 Tax=Capsicum annuum TaxID=4072 RepID=A0A2G2Y342_CAPAN|nr:putative poly(A) RNA polymerase GLD2-like [Capsicum annuum]KAF3658739.1 putative poly(A) RNA polymerase GLD2-like [Capsicum annuum]PHT64165.1 hypothetical protein T459_32038 [Capsicum annuum]
MDSKKKTGGNCFQMPLHYPRYTKEDYQHMPEWMIDKLLAEYGLPANGDLANKRKFAMGAFVWPHCPSKPTSHLTTSHQTAFVDKTT